MYFLSGPQRGGYFWSEFWLPAVKQCISLHLFIYHKGLMHLKSCVCPEGTLVWVKIDCFWNLLSGMLCYLKNQYKSFKIKLWPLTWQPMAVIFLWFSVLISFLEGHYIDQYIVPLSMKKKKTVTESDLGQRHKGEALHLQLCLLSALPAQLTLEYPSGCYCWHAHP